MSVHDVSAHGSIPDVQVKATTSPNPITFRSIMPIQTTENKSEVKNCNRLTSAPSKKQTNKKAITTLLLYALKKTVLYKSLYK